MAEIEADEVAASLKFATAKVECASERGPSDRSQGRSGRPSAAVTSMIHRPSRVQ
jgi:hypothetical protein